MKDSDDDFQYESFPAVPEDFRRVDWTFIESRDRPFAESVAAFDDLKNELHESFADKPFAWLHFLRAIEERVLMLAINTRQPVEICLNHLRRRLDLEYGRDEVSGKAMQAVILARYFAGLSHANLAKSLLIREREGLEEMIEVCKACLETVNQCMGELPDEPLGSPPKT